jgi:hypothetical protein
MKHRFIESPRIFGGFLTVLLVVTATAPLTAVTAATPARPYYDTREEITLAATVNSVIVRPAAGMAIGPHLLLATASGTVDASLGKWGMTGKGALSVSAGQPVVVTGVMKVLKNRPVLVVRTVKAGGKVYVMRNEHGIPEPPQSRVHSNDGQQGGGL